MIKFLDLFSQYNSIKTEIDKSIENVIKNSAFIGGKYLQDFEEQFANFCNVKNCIGVGNGTDALEIAIEALGIKPGSEIIVPANSFIASSEAVKRAGCKVVFADFDIETYTISVSDVERLISPNTAAIIAVHLYGHPCDMDRLLELTFNKNIFLIEDCAQAHGAEYKGKKVGSIGDISAFSFYPGKNLGAYGDGGAILTNNNDLANRCRMIANHGRIDKYDHKFEGRNSRLDSMQAAILSVKLRKLNEWTDKRIYLANIYSEKLSNQVGLCLPKKQAYVKHVYHLFVVRVKERDALIKCLKNEGIETGIHYPTLLPALKAYSYLNKKELFSKKSNINSELISLPMGEHLTGDEVSFVSEKVISFMGKKC